MATIFKRNGKGSYIIQYFDQAGVRRERSSRTTDYRTAERIANKLEADVALRRDGVIDPKIDAIAQESKRTIESHLVHFEAKMTAASRAAKHITSTLRAIREIAKARGFETVAEITADGVNTYASDLKKEGRSARTVQAHLTAIKAFTKWLTVDGKLSADPLVSVKKPNPQTDRRRERRILLPEELRRLRLVTMI